MKQYAIVELEVTDPAWVPDYLAAVTPMVQRHGGRYLARTDRLERLEGDRALPHVVAVIEFPDREAAVRFYESAEYAPHLAARAAGARCVITLVAGHDMAGSGPVSPT